MRRWKASARAAVGLLAVVTLGVVALSGGSSDDPRTPEGMPGQPPPFLTAAVLGAGDLTAGIDAYGDVVDLRAPGPAGVPLIDNSYERQLAGTVPAQTGIVPMFGVAGEEPRPLWSAEAVTQRYRPGTNVLRTTAAVRGTTASIECAADGGELGCVSSVGGPGPGLEVGFGRYIPAGGRIHLDDPAARRILERAASADRAWLSRRRPLGPGAPDWAEEMYERSLLVMRALTDSRSGAVAAGARDHWAYVWPRDAGAVALALAGAGYRSEARRVARFLLGLDLGSAARFRGDGTPVPGRAAQGDASGWVAVAARAAGLPPPRDRLDWRDRADYQERAAGDYLGNALRVGFGPRGGSFETSMTWTPAPTRRRPGRSVPSPSRSSTTAAARTLRRLISESGPFGIVPSQDWGEPDPWTAPTAWSAWSLAALDRAESLRLLGDLRRAATPAGLLPERVDARTGIPRSTAPLAWSHAFTALALQSLWPGDRPSARPAPRAGVGPP